MSLLPGIGGSSNSINLPMFNNTILPYTFTTGELEQLKTKLLSADSQMSAAKQQTGMLSMSISEIRTLLRMIDMTYLQGLSSSQNVLPTISTPEIPQSNMMNSSGMGMNQRSPNPRQPPPNYLCYICRVPGHFINDCPQKQQGGGRNKQQKPPPANYVCHKCQVGGHWIHECPYSNGGGMNQMGSNQRKQTDYTQPPPANYVCHRCHVPGHWIKNCPTNNDPNYNPQNQHPRQQQNGNQGGQGQGQRGQQSTQGGGQAPGPQQQQQQQQAQQQQLQQVQAQQGGQNNGPPGTQPGQQGQSQVSKQPSGNDNVNNPKPTKILSKNKSQKYENQKSMKSALQWQKKNER